MSLFSFFKKKPKQPELHEFSTGFDTNWVRPFLERIEPLIESGFDSEEIEEICQFVAKLPREKEGVLEFEVWHAGKRTPLYINVFMDDIDSPDIAFFTSAALAEQIKAECMRYFEELGV